MMRNVIKTILRENDDFDWARQTNPKRIQKTLNGYSAEYDVVLEYFNTKPTLEYMGWNYEILTGTIEWWKEGFVGEFYATPYWDGNNYLPIDFQGEYEYEHVTEILLPEFEYEEELINWLDNEYPKIVLKEITDFIGPLNESTDFFDSLKDDEEKPKIIPGGIIDTLVGNFSQEEILQRLHELGYTWKNHYPIYRDGELEFTPYRYIYIGPIDRPIDLDAGRLLHDEDLDYVKENNLLDLVYRT